MAYDLHAKSMRMSPTGMYRKAIKPTLIPIVLANLFYKDGFMVCQWVDSFMCPFNNF
jgi:hypothetical protein